MEERYKEIKTQLGITDADVAQMFGYKSRVVFANSIRKSKVVKGIVELFDRIESRRKSEQADDESAQQ